MRLKPEDRQEQGDRDSLIRRFSVAVSSGPERFALRSGERRLTYRELDEWSDAVAGILRSRGIRRGDRVALRMVPEAEAITAILGILKCGASYVPLDVRHPASRKEFIVADSGVCALVGEWGEGTLGPAVGILVGTAEVASALASCAARPAGRAAQPAGSLPTAQDTAYIIYTSGTTGSPKGVPVRHCHVTALLSGAEAVFEFGAQDRWLLFHSIAFDFSVWEIWGALSTGAELVVLPHGATRSPDQCLQAVAQHGITVLNQTPTAFASIAEAAVRAGAELPALRYVVFGGEKLVPAGLRHWVKTYGLSQPRLVNGYGITETTVFTTFHEIGEDDLAGDESTIGVALPGFRVRVVGDDGRDVPVGRLGELWLAGPQVTDGYLNRPELTAERFSTAADPASGAVLRYYCSGDLVSLAPDGSLVYQGRADLQVKLRGYRIELSDIEAAVRRHEAVLDAVVSVREFKAADSRLVCAYVTRAGAAAPEQRQLRQHIKELLPSYMHPARYLRLSELPRTVNGKVDRAAVARAWEEGKEHI